MVQYADILYGSVTGNESEQAKDSTGEVDIEKEINEEVMEMKESRTEGLFHPVKIEIQCGKLIPIFDAAPG